MSVATSGKVRTVLTGGAFHNCVFFFDQDATEAYLAIPPPADDEEHEDQEDWTPARYQRYNLGSGRGIYVATLTAAQMDAAEAAG